MRAFLSLILGATLWLGAFGAAAEVPGQAAPGFAAAVERWLEADEAEALPELSALAREGNTAARVLLALIDRTPALQGPWLAKLPHEARIPLLRGPGGMSGTGWMHAAAAEAPLAQLWLSHWAGEGGAEAALAFAALGEDRAAREALLLLAARQRSGFLAHADHPGFPPGLRALAWRDGARGDGAIARHAEAIADLPGGDPQRWLLGLAPAEPDLADWLLVAVEAGAVAQLCRDACPGGIAACALAAFEALGGVVPLLAFGSPSERLIPPERFHASRRGQAALLRRILLNADARGRRAQIARARAADACFGDLLDAEAQRYMPQQASRD